MGQNVAWVRSARHVKAFPAIGCMSNWRTQLAIAVLTLSISPAGAQSLGDVARSERERRARMAHHAPMLTDEDLRRDQILKKTPSYSDSALPSPDNSTSTNVDENVPLGDYARALRQRRVAEPAAPASAIATGPAPEPQPAAVAIVAQPVAAPAAADQKPTSLGDLAREVRAERAAARRVRIQEQKRAAAVQQKAAQPEVAQQNTAHSKPVQSAASNRETARADKAAHEVTTAHAVPAPPASPKPAHQPKVAQPAVQARARVAAAPAVKRAQLTELAAKPSAQPVGKTFQQGPVRQRAAQPAVQATKKVVHADQIAHTAPAPAVSVKPAQLTTVAAKPSVQPAPQPRTIQERDITAGEQSIRVPRGASLWSLARTYLGAGNLWAALWKANPQIKDPNRIRAGQTLRLPDLDDDDNPASNGF